MASASSCALTSIGSIFRASPTGVRLDRGGSRMTVTAYAVARQRQPASFVRNTRHRAGAAVASDRARGTHVDAARPRIWRCRCIWRGASNRPTNVRRSHDGSSRLHHRPVRAARCRRRGQSSAGTRAAGVDPLIALRLRIAHPTRRRNVRVRRGSSDGRDRECMWSCEPDRNRTGSGGYVGYLRITPV